MISPAKVALAVRCISTNVRGTLALLTQSNPVLLGRQEWRAGSQSENPSRGGDSRAAAMSGARRLDRQSARASNLSQSFAAEAVAPGRHRSLGFLRLRSSRALSRCAAANNSWNLSSFTRDGQASRASFQPFEPAFDFGLSRGNWSPLKYKNSLEEARLGLLLLFLLTLFVSFRSVGS